MRKPRVVIDASSLMFDKPLCGISRTTLELIRAIEGLDDPPVELCLFGQRLRRDRLQKYHFNSRVSYLPLPRWKSLEWVRSALPSVELLTRCDLLHIPHNYSPVHRPERTVVTIHDAMFAVYAEQHLHRESNKQDFSHLAQRCRLVITCSHNSKQDLVSASQVDPDKIRVIPWGYDSKVFYPTDDADLVRTQLRQQFELDRPYFLSVSCDIGRKNSPALVREFLKVASQGSSHDLVMVWRNPPEQVRSMIERDPSGHMVHLFPHVTDDELRLLYCGATAMLFPSKYEGFGLPVLEALACGTPVVTCRVSSLPEVGGDAALYIEPGNDDALRETMQTFLEGRHDIESLRQKCLTQASRFSWEKTARETIQVYVDALGML